MGGGGVLWHPPFFVKGPLTKKGLAFSFMEIP